MAKGIIVVEIPEKCMDCPCYDEDVCYCDIADKRVKEAVNSGSKPDWCPIHPLPEKDKENYVRADSYWRKQGWNACLNMIMGEEG